MAAMYLYFVAAAARELARAGGQLDDLGSRGVRNSSYFLVFG